MNIKYGATLNNYKNLSLKAKVEYRNNYIKCEAYMGLKKTMSLVKSCLGEEFFSKYNEISK